MMTCHEALRLASKKMDVGLSFRQRASLWLHLLICVYCRRFLQQARFLRRFLAAFQDHAHSGEVQLGEAGRQRILQAIQNNRK